MAVHKGKIIIVSAPSGSGKTTIVRQVLANTPEVTFSVSATTRKPRNVEVHGKDYFFISKEEFENGIKEGAFAEWERLYDYYYGTYKKFISDTISNGKSILLEIDVKGALNIKSQYPDAISVFIMPPDLETLKQRLKNRKTENEEDLKKRIDLAEHEINEKDNFDFVIVNAELDTAVKEVHDLILKIIDKEN